MIDTNSMYGNVAEEQDAFQLIQKRQAAEKAAAAAKKYAVPGIDSKNDYEASKKLAAEEKAAEAAKKLTAEEIVLPDFPKEYNPETALETMFNM